MPTFCSCNLHAVHVGCMRTQMLTMSAPRRRRGAPAVPPAPAHAHRSGGEAEPSRPDRPDLAAVVSSPSSSRRLQPELHPVGRRARPRAPGGTAPRASAPTRRPAARSPRSPAAGRATPPSAGSPAPPAAPARRAARATPRLRVGRRMRLVVDEDARHIERDRRPEAARIRCSIRSNAGEAPPAVTIRPSIT